MRQHVRYGTVRYGTRVLQGMEGATTANNLQLTEGILPIFLCSPRGGRFFAKEDPLGVNSKVGGGS